MKLAQYYLFPVIALLILPRTDAQEDRFFMPREIKQAYENGTRSYDGRPGPNYWQNTADYTIEVEVDPATRELTGSESITYYNNSPDDLNILIIRLYQDNFRKGNQRGSSVRPDDVNDGVEISRLVVGDSALNVDQSTRRQGTNMIVTLPEAIVSGSSIELEIDWQLVIPQTTIRMGAYDSTSFFVSYWYPQIAVYDDVFGWDGLSHDFSTEFYNELGNFDVRITAPVNFTVIATGALQNPQEIFTSDKLSLYEKATQSEETVTILSKEDATNGYEHKFGTWHFRAGDVTDFSFCLSDHFVWDAAIQKVEDRNVLIHSYYNVSVADRATQLTAIQQKTMKHFSEDMPGVPYPYPEFATCVMAVGGGGMETPMMANNGQPGQGVTIHEMMHTYFPMYVRVNEKRFAWMDEGWANFNTTYLTIKYFQGQELSPGNFGSGGVSGTLGSFSDLPMITSTQFLDNSNYGYASYPLPEFLYGILHHHLGDELFQQCYSTYIRDWAKKSPTPYDFMYTFERVSGQDLSWFWKPWFFGFGDVDVRIGSYNKGKLTVENQGTRPVPILVNAIYDDSTTWTGEYSAKSWEGSGMFKVKIPDHKKLAKFDVNGSLPDANSLDNYYPSLRDRYGDFEIEDRYLGSYSITQFPINVILSEQEGLIHLRVTNAGLESFMEPLSDTKFQSLDGNIICELTPKDDGVDLRLQLRNFGVTVTGSK
jgi:hypothetical protein